jgi:hypothetical protein
MRPDLRSYVKASSESGMLFLFVRTGLLSLSFILDLSKKRGVFEGVGN